MWFKVDESALDDWRIALLAKRIGGVSYADALLACMRVWRQLYNRAGGVMGPDEIDAAGRVDGLASKMAECELADAVIGGFRIRGDERAKEFSGFRKSQSRKGALRHAKGSGDYNEVAGAEPGLSRGLAGAEPPISISSDLDLGSESEPDQASFALVSPVPERVQEPTVAERLWALQNELRKQVDKSARELRPNADRLKRVEDRLRDSSEEDCIHVLHVYAANASRNGSLEWFNGETNWRKDNFDRALGQTPTKPISKSGDTVDSLLLRLAKEDRW